MLTYVDIAKVIEGDNVNNSGLGHTSEFITNLYIIQDTVLGTVEESKVSKTWIHLVKHS